MANTLKVATLKVETKEVLNLGGADWGSVSVVEDEKIQRGFRRVFQFTAGNSPEEIIDFAGSVSGVVEADDVKYIRFRNMDDAVGMVLLVQLANDEFVVQPLAAGRTLYSWDLRYDFLASSSSWEDNYTLGNPDRIEALVDSTDTAGNWNLEIFVALVA